MAGASANETRGPARDDAVEDEEAVEGRCDVAVCGGKPLPDEPNVPDLGPGRVTLDERAAEAVARAETVEDADVDDDG